MRVLLHGGILNNEYCLIRAIIIPLYMPVGWADDCGQNLSRHDHVINIMVQMNSSMGSWGLCEADWTSLQLDGLFWFEKWHGNWYFMTQHCLPDSYLCIQVEWRGMCCVRALCWNCVRSWFMSLLFLVWYHWVAHAQLEIAPHFRNW